MLKTCLTCLQRSQCVKKTRYWISLMCQQNNPSLPMLLQKSLHQREKVIFLLRICIRICFIERSFKSESCFLFWVQYLKNLWKLDSEEKNVMEPYIAPPSLDYYHSFSWHFFLMWAHEAHCVKLAKEQGSWNFQCDMKKKMLIIMFHECFGWFLKIKSVWHNWWITINKDICEMGKCHSNTSFVIRFQNVYICFCVLYKLK